MYVENINVRGAKLLERMFDGDMHALDIVSAVIGFDADRGVRALVRNRVLHYKLAKFVCQ